LVVFEELFLSVILLAIVVFQLHAVSSIFVIVSVFMAIFLEGSIQISIQAHAHREFLCEDLRLGFFESARCIIVELRELVPIIFLDYVLRGQVNLLFVICKNACRRATMSTTIERLKVVSARGSLGVGVLFCVFVIVIISKKLLVVWETLVLS
jgi:hypothetical protein